MTRIIAIILMFITMLTAAHPSVAGSVYADNRADINRIEDYLNAVKTLRAKFVQVSTSGNAAEGKIYLSRPNRMRFVYNDPTPIELVADGASLVYHDVRLGQVSYLSIESSPLAPILRDRVQLDDNSIKLTKFRKFHDELSLTFIKPDDPASGEVTIQFSENPFTLRRWVIRDAQDVVTTVSLLDVETGVDIDPKLFKFNDPRPLNQRLD